MSSLCMSSRAYRCCYTKFSCCNKFMAATKLCRLCEAELSTRGYVSLFSNCGEKQQWSSRIYNLLETTVCQGDGGSDYMCCKCQRRIEHLEKAAEDLEQFKATAKHSNKRVRDTSGTGTSPVSQPAVKRTRHRLDFGQGTASYT